MNRRGFFASLAGAAAGVIVGPELAELLVPKRTIFLPPAGGWHGNRLISVDMLAKELLCVLEQSLEFSAAMDRDYDTAFIDGDLWRFGPATTEVFTQRPFEFNKIDVKRPPRYR